MPVWFFLRILLASAARYGISQAGRYIVGRLIGSAVAAITTPVQPDDTGVTEATAATMEEAFLDEAHEENDIVPDLVGLAEEFEAAANPLLEDPLSEFEDGAQTPVADESDVESEEGEQNNFANESDEDGQGDETDFADQLDNEILEDYNPEPATDSSTEIADDLEDDHDQAEFAAVSTDDAVSPELNENIDADLSERFDDFLSSLTADSEALGLELSASELLTDVYSDEFGQGLLEEIEQNNFVDFPDLEFDDYDLIGEG